MQWFAPLTPTTRRAGPFLCGIFGPLGTKEIALTKTTKGARARGRDGGVPRIELARSRGLGHAAIHNSTNHFLSTFRGQPSILVSVHSVLRESLRFGNISVPGSDRMDNLPKVHS